MLESLGAEAREVRTPEQLQGLDGLVIPGGESTTISKGMARDGLDEVVRAHAAAGRPILGSCAGMIVCDRDHLGIGDYRCRRNAFGRQRHSFEHDLRIEGLGEEPLRAVFIRAPWVEEAGSGVEVLAEVDGPLSPFASGTCWPSPSTPSSPTTVASTRCSWRWSRRPRR